MSREAQVRFWEGVGVKFPRATHLFVGGLFLFGIDQTNGVGGMGESCETIGVALCGKAASPVPGVRPDSFLCEEVVALALDANAMQGTPASRESRAVDSRAGEKAGSLTPSTFFALPLSRTSRNPRGNGVAAFRGGGIGVSSSGSPFNRPSQARLSDLPGFR